MSETQGITGSATRPLHTLSEFVGQNKIRENLSVFMAAARGRREPLDHVLLSGPPGIGKTTLAKIIAREMGVGLRSVSAPSLQSKGELAGILTNFQPRDCLLIEDVHCLNSEVQGVLRSAMEDWRLEIIISKGPMARVFKHDLPPFTLIGETSRPEALSDGFRALFGIRVRLDPTTFQQ